MTERASSAPVFIGDAFTVRADHRRKRDRYGYLDEQAPVTSQAGETVPALVHVYVVEKRAGRPEGPSRSSTTANPTSDMAGCRGLKPTTEAGAAAQPIRWQPRRCNVVELRGFLIRDSGPARRAAAFGENYACGY
ncbi:MAG: hypothetical protein J2P17_21110 [Mycobacterium sp.]|nr:hypothetical protein [Mycobacterium sp.]